ncbi:RNA-binding KH domain-containing protein PEPPER-like [Populus nigra]|uniref:RNA-binding KH domain-containing protein PEPPER-like n=1 Tax=Populus nigra TaxID=3691 RepID=UPI002B27144C|nr:RNA-binding KH domain-containing protein PEPPER-like [Populus nigra]
MDLTATTTLNSDPKEANAVNKQAETGMDAATEGGQQQGQPKGSEKWPGWPGDNVFRLIVPVSKVGSIIGRRGELVKKMCDETLARIRILEGPLGISDRIVLISGKEEPEAPQSPAMDAVMRVFKRVSGLSPGEGDNTGSAAAAAGSAFCSIRLLVASSQAINLIGKQGSIIKSIQENTGAAVHVMAEDELPSYATSDERIVEIHGEAMKVFKALEAVIGQLRKFLVDHSVIPIFEKTYNATISQECPADARPDIAQPSLHSAYVPTIPSGIASDYSLSLKRDPSIYEHETQFEHKISQPGLSIYGQDSGIVGFRSTGLGRATAPIVTQVTQTMQVPLSYAEDIIGVAGSNIAYIRRTSRAILSIQESRGLPDEITVEIKGTGAQVQMAQQLIQEFITNHKEPASSMYGKIDAGLSAYSHMAETGYPSSSFTSHLGGYGSSSMGGYGSPGAGGYNNYRF